MVKATGEARLDMITNLLNQILAELIAAEWELSTTVSCYQGKDSSLERGNYRGLMLTYQILKTSERITENLIRQQVEIDEMQFGFMPGCGKTSFFFILRLLEIFSKKEEFLLCICRFRENL